MRERDIFKFSRWRWAQRHVLLAPSGKSVALELVAATIGAKMLDFLDDHGVGLLLDFLEVRLNHYHYFSACFIFKYLKEALLFLVFALAKHRNPALSL